MEGVLETEQDKYEYGGIALKAEMCLETFFGGRVHSANTWHIMIKMKKVTESAMINMLLRPCLH